MDTITVLGLCMMAGILGALLSAAVVGAMFGKRQTWLAAEAWRQAEAAELRDKLAALLAAPWSGGSNLRGRILAAELEPTSGAALRAANVAVNLLMAEDRFQAAHPTRERPRVL